MHTFADLQSLARGRPAIVTIGAFDGVHRGHQYLIRQVVERARQLDFDSTVVTFDPRPQVVLRPSSLQLTGAAEKERIIGALGPTNLVVLPFTRELSEVPAGQFLVSILEHVNLAEIWIGADFAFGHNREGNVPFLIQTGQKSGFSVHVVARKGLDGRKISSTTVRELVAAGSVGEAAQLLGHFLRVGGTVVSGHGRGAEMGFPTANLEIPSWQQLPANGIYAAYLCIDSERLSAAVSVGTNPTFGGGDVVVESYILDYMGDLRGSHVDLDFVARIRDEERFDSVDALLDRMRIDVEETRSLLANAEEPGELLL